MSPPRHPPPIPDPAAAARDVATALDVIEAEARAVASLAARLRADGGPFAEAVERVLRCRGRVVVTGMGKAGLVGRKLAATLASTGTPALSLHPAEAVHGDLGQVVPDDLVLALSNSGATAEILRIVPFVHRLGAPIVAITGDARSELGRSADVVLALGAIVEGGPLGFVPTASTAAMGAYGDALALAVAGRRGLSRDQFAAMHPGGELGRRLTRVGDVMRRGERNPVTRADATLREAATVMTDTPGRPGAVSLVDAEGRLVGILTDGDLRRQLLRGSVTLDGPVAALMKRGPRTIDAGDLAADAARELAEAQVDQIVVVDDAGRPVGLVDVQDLLAMRLV